jgi:hypothetical protein
MDRVGPDGQRLDARQRARYRPAEERVGAAVAAHLAAHPFATEGDLERVRASERAKAQHSVPYFDFTVSAAKSVSVLHASLLVAARQARAAGRHGEAGELERDLPSGRCGRWPRTPRWPAGRPSSTAARIVAACRRAAPGRSWTPGSSGPRSVRWPPCLLCTQRCGRLPRRRAWSAPGCCRRSSAAASSAARSTRPSARRRRSPGPRCCGRSTGPCLPWRRGWTRPPWPRSWRPRRCPRARCWPSARRRTRWTCPRSGSAPRTAAACTPAGHGTVHHPGPPGSGGVSGR